MRVWLICKKIGSGKVGDQYRPIFEDLPEKELGYFPKSVADFSKYRTALCHSVFPIDEENYLCCLGAPKHIITRAIERGCKIIADEDAQRILGNKMKDHIVIDHELIFVCHVLGIKEGIESYTIEDEPAILEEVCNQVGEEVKDMFSQLKNKIREYDTEAHNTLMNLIIKSLS